MKMWKSPRDTTVGSSYTVASPAVRIWILPPGLPHLLMITFQKRAELRGKQRDSAGKRPERSLHPLVIPAGILRRWIGKRRFGDASEMKDE